MAKSSILSKASGSSSSKAKALGSSHQTDLVKSPIPIRNYILGLANVAKTKLPPIFKRSPFEKQDDNLKRKLAKNNEAKMVLYNALPKKDQVKDNKIDLLVQQYEQFTILEEESIDSGFASDNASSLNDDSMEIEYDHLCEICLKIINNNKILKTKIDLLEKETLELNEKIKKLERNKEIDIVCELCQELKLENAKLKETQVKFVKFDKSANSLREMLNNQKSSSCKIGLGFDSSKASTSGTKPINFVGSSAEIAPDGSTIKAHGSTIPGSVDPSCSEKKWQNTFLGTYVFEIGFCYY
ncbi:hypothetical protein Tco_0038913 [Tanacetum coccineum]